MANVILRPVYNRPEMLALSLEYEAAAREYYMLPGEFKTLFLVEYGTPEASLDLLRKYQFDRSFIIRQKKFGLTINILEGMKVAFDEADDYVVYIEDDILVHRTYFQYMDVLLNMKEIGKFSVLSPYDKTNDGDVNVVYKGHHYAALAPLINKEFHQKYILPCSNNSYYSNPPRFVIALNEKYKEHWGPKGYKYKDAAHYEQAGIINRKVDVAMIEEDMYVILPRINRHQHIGFYGKNRPRGIIPGNSFEERLENLREIITDADKMYSLTVAKQYNDYKIFNPKLDDWDGILRFVNV